MQFLQQFNIMSIIQNSLRSKSLKKEEHGKTLDFLTIKDYWIEQPENSSDY